MPLKAATPVFALVTALVLAVLALGGGKSALADPSVAPKGNGGFAYTNRLINSDDPYLRLHAHNPVDWYPWGSEAFAKAKSEGKPIFLSIGYSTCYWCHVAEKTIYSDPAIAAVMNKWFVNVKVDREQRPDVDRLYIIATEMLTQHGAWPNNLFLTPDGKPFYAGSYFPPHDEPGAVMGFPSVLAAIHDLWVNHRAEKVTPAADELFGALTKVAAAQLAKPPVAVTPVDWMKQATQKLSKVIDRKNGGLGSPTGGPKFPQTPALDLLLASADLGKDDAARHALTDTLEAMSYGGIHDQLGGGFHRYATEPTWTVPHFEKMLSDNAQLLSLYARAYRLTNSALLRDVAADTAGYLMRDMQAPDGGFYTAQDAEIGGVEGADYLWTRQEIEKALGAAATEEFLAVYEIAAMPEAAPFGDPKAKRETGGVLRIRVPIAETLRRAGASDSDTMLATLAPDRVKLLAVRQTRKQPATDHKIVTGLNGLAIGALAQAGTELSRDDFTAAARKAAERIWSTSFNSTRGALKHEIIGGKADVDGYIDDYAMFGDGLLTLADASHEEVWRKRAAAIADAMLKRFATADGRLATGADAGLPVALTDDSDSEMPSGTSAALALLTRLGERADGARFVAAAAKLAVASSGQIGARPQAWPSAVVALVRHPIPAALAAAAPAPRTQVATNGADQGTAAPGVPATSDHVHVSAKLTGDEIAVTLKVDAGYHINAHQPSFDYLVPTDLSFGGLTPSGIDYPPAVRLKTAFAPEGLDVYEGDVRLVAHFPAGVLSGVMGLEGKVTAQACDAKTCLPPASLPVSIANPG